MASLLQKSTPWIERSFIYAASYVRRDANSIGNNDNGNGDGDATSRCDDSNAHLFDSQYEMEPQTENTVPSGLLPSPEHQAGGGNANKSRTGVGGMMMMSEPPSRKSKIVQIIQRAGNFDYFDKQDGHDESEAAANTTDSTRMIPPYFILHDGNHSALAFLSPETVSGLRDNRNNGNDNDNGKWNIPPNRALISINQYTISTILQCVSTDTNDNIANNTNNINSNNNNNSNSNANNNLAVHAQIINNLFHNHPSLLPLNTHTQILHDISHTHLFLCLYLQSHNSITLIGAENQGLVGEPIDVHASLNLRRVYKEHELGELGHGHFIWRLASCHCRYQMMMMSMTAVEGENRRVITTPGRPTQRGRSGSLFSSPESSLASTSVMSRYSSNAGGRNGRRKKKQYGRRARKERDENNNKKEEEECDWPPDWPWSSESIIASEHDNVAGNNGVPVNVNVPLEENGVDDANSATTNTNIAATTNNNDAVLGDVNEFLANESSQLDALDNAENDTTSDNSDPLFVNVPLEEDENDNDENDDASSANTNTNANNAAAATENNNDAVLGNVNDFLANESSQLEKALLDGEESDSDGDTDATIDFNDMAGNNNPSSIMKMEDDMEGGIIGLDLSGIAEEEDEVELVEVVVEEKHDDGAGDNGEKEKESKDDDDDGVQCDLGNVFETEDRASGGGDNDNNVVVVLGEDKRKDDSNGENGDDPSQNDDQHEDDKEEVNEKAVNNLQEELVGDPKQQQNNNEETADGEHDIDEKSREEGNSSSSDGGAEAESGQASTENNINDNNAAPIIAQRNVTELLLGNLVTDLLRSGNNSNDEINDLNNEETAGGNAIGNAQEQQQEEAEWNNKNGNNGDGGTEAESGRTATNNGNVNIAPTIAQGNVTELLLENFEELDDLLCLDSSDDSSPSQPAVEEEVQGRVTTTIPQSGNENGEDEPLIAGNMSEKQQDSSASQVMQEGQQGEGNAVVEQHGADDEEEEGTGILSQESGTGGNVASFVGIDDMIVDDEDSEEEDEEGQQQGSDNGENGPDEQLATQPESHDHGVGEDLTCQPEFEQAEDGQQQGSNNDENGPDEQLSTQPESHGPHVGGDLTCQPEFTTNDHYEDEVEEEGSLSQIPVSTKGKVWNLGQEVEVHEASDDDDDNIPPASQIPLMTMKVLGEPAEHPEKSNRQQQDEDERGPESQIPRLCTTKRSSKKHSSDGRHSLDQQEEEVQEDVSIHNDDRRRESQIPLSTKKWSPKKKKKKKKRSSKRKRARQDQEDGYEVPMSMRKAPPEMLGQTTADGTDGNNDNRRESQIPILTKSVSRPVEQRSEQQKQQQQQQQQQQEDDLGPECQIPLPLDRKEQSELTKQGIQKANEQEFCDEPFFARGRSSLQHHHFVGRKLLPPNKKRSKRQHKISQAIQKLHDSDHDSSDDRMRMSKSPKKSKMPTFRSNVPPPAITGNSDSNDDEVLESQMAAGEGSEESVPPPLLSEKNLGSGQKKKSATTKRCHSQGDGDDSGYEGGDAQLRSEGTHPNEGVAPADEQNDRFSGDDKLKHHHVSFAVEASNDDILDQSCGNLGEVSSKASVESGTNQPVFAAAHMTDNSDTEANGSEHSQNDQEEEIGRHSGNGTGRRKRKEKAGEEPEIIDMIRILKRAKRLYSGV